MTEWILLSGTCRAQWLVGRVGAPPGALRLRDRVCTRRSDGGYVIAEAVVAIPALLAVACALAWVLSVASASVALGDAARQAARELARGIPVEQALDEAAQGVPGAQVVLVDGGDPLRVVASRQVTAPVPILSGISITVSQGVSIPREWL